MIAGIIKKRATLFCRRCLNDKQRLFATYRSIINGEEIIYCRRCTEVVQSNSQTEITDVITRRTEVISFSICIPFSLTGEQARAVFLLECSIIQHRMIMLQAVCGAGKTEIIAVIIARYLGRGLKVGWAIARKDVVIELKQRLETYFPQTKIIALYQKSENLGEEGQLIVLTTARLGYYYKSFDVLVIDENDAYPFSVNQFQQDCAQTSVVEQGKIIYISATILTKDATSYDDIISLPQRFHGEELPEIMFSYCPNMKHKSYPSLNQKLQQQLNKWYRQRKPVFIFASSKNLGLALTKKLVKHYGESIACISSDINDRQEILEKIRRGQLMILVTTTILERGVTFAGVQVIVADADNPIFDAATLVQIAGRVGRTSDEHQGEIYFGYTTNITKEMIKARKYHQNANKGTVIFL
ncbi:MAG: helicase-related protein [Culicoidibacterales bacterium]